jgi:cytochrome c
MKTNAAILAVFGLAVLAAQGTRTVWDGVYNEAQSNRGKDLYTGQCATCHGAQLTGADSAPPLAGPEFLSAWNGMTVGDLAARIRRTMPQDDPGTLSPQQNSDIVAYILSVNKFPAGKDELAKETEPLKQIKIQAAKPN